MGCGFLPLVRSSAVWGGLGFSGLGECVLVLLIVSVVYLVFFCIESSSLSSVIRWAPLPHRLVNVEISDCKKKTIFQINDTIIRNLSLFFSFQDAKNHLRVLYTLPNSYLPIFTYLISWEASPFSFPGQAYNQVIQIF